MSNSSLFIVLHIFLISGEKNIYKQVDSLKKEGYLKAYVISTDTGNFLVKGPLIRIRSISFDGIQESAVKDAFVDIGKKWEGKVSSIKNLETILFQILSFLENKGYPFAKARFKSFDIKNDSLFSVISVEKGPLALIENIRINGLKKTNAGSVQRIFRNIKGKVYTPSLLEPGKKKLDFFPFLNFKGIDFEKREGKIWLVLSLEDEASNLIKGSIGYEREKGGLFGFFNIELLNLFGTLRKLNIHWRRISKGNQDLELLYFEPFIPFFDLGFSPFYSFSQRETLYIKENIEGQIYFFIYPIALGIGGGYEKSKNFQKKLSLHRVKNILSLQGGKKSLFFKKGFFLFSKGEVLKSKEDILYRIDLNLEQRFLKGFLGFLIGGGWKNIYRKERNYSPSEAFWIGGIENFIGYREEQFLTTEAKVFQTEIHFLTGKNFSLFSLFNYGALKLFNGDIFKGYSYGTGLCGKKEGTEVEIIFAIPSLGGINAGKIHFSLENRF